MGASCTAPPKRRPPPKRPAAKARPAPRRPQTAPPPPKRPAATPPPLATPPRGVRGTGPESADRSDRQPLRPAGLKPVSVSPPPLPSPEHRQRTVSTPSAHSFRGMRVSFATSFFADAQLEDWLLVVPAGRLADLAAASLLPDGHDPPRGLTLLLRAAAKRRWCVFTGRALCMYTAVDGDEVMSCGFKDHSVVPALATPAVPGAATPATFVPTGPLSRVGFAAVVANQSGPGLSPGAASPLFLFASEKPRGTAVWLRELTRAGLGRSVQIKSRSMSMHRHQAAFDGLLEAYKGSVSASLHSDVDAADVPGVAQHLRELTDPRELALLKLSAQLTDGAPLLAEELDAIWDRFDRDGDGELSASENADLVLAYLGSLESFIPSLLHDLARRVFDLFSGGRLQYEAALARVRADTTSSVRRFFKDLKSSHRDIAAEMLGQLDVDGDGVVTRADFKAAFLTCKEIQGIGTAVQSAVGDALAYRVRNAIVSGLGSAPGRCGLQNMGNTCYMNSAVQCLSASHSLRQSLIAGAFKGQVQPDNALGSGGRVTEALASLLREMWSGEKVVRPGAFKQTVGSVRSEFSGWGQEDSQEFVSFVLDAVHEDLNSAAGHRPGPAPATPPGAEAEHRWRSHIARNQSLVVDMFHGQLRAVIACDGCGKDVRSYDPVALLSVPVPASGPPTTVTDCLSAFAAPERLTGWACGGCGGVGTRTLQVCRLPEYLVVHLKRFRASPTGAAAAKINTAVRVCQELSTSGWAARECGDRYRLYAVTNHYGTATQGHYTACCRLADAWLNFDDSNVSQLAQAPYAAASDAPYLLWYRRL
eukprot:TRINITY_DN47222_c0_g1_i1.p1 TRINITY_DN47222_c0_g1~~TRINITY_DN47222_c0_g1_i1.p1  ORF type:complete len:829 (+),score=295.74 TRINITY_DN47222_c0_g1_i1:35-2488(+)